MTQADERIMEFLQEKDIVASPSVIAANIDYTGEYISRRCRKLADAGLLQRVDSTNYRLTGLGERFLEEDIGADAIEIDWVDDFLVASQSYIELDVKNSNNILLPADMVL